MAGRVFADTSALLALAHRRDQYHGRAARFARTFVREGGRFVTTPLVAAELHGLLLYRLGADTGRVAIDAMLADPLYQWISIDEDIMTAATGDWLEKYRDHPITLCDAVSFEVMRRGKVRNAFAFDRHFEIAGYRLVG